MVDISHVLPSASGRKKPASAGRSPHTSPRRKENGSSGGWGAPLAWCHKIVAALWMMVASY